MSALRELAPAKINLGLTLGPLREDGRHRLVTVMQPVALCDSLELVPAALGSSSDETFCPGVEGENLVDAALAGFRKASGWRGADAMPRTSPAHRPARCGTRRPAPATAIRHRCSTP